LREQVKTLNSETARLNNLAEEYELAIADSKSETKGLRKDLEDARQEQHRLEDEFELQRQELDRLNQQLRESQRSILESQKLAQDEVTLKKSAAQS
jgi:hypothetical protein